MSNDPHGGTPDDPHGTEVPHLPAAPVQHHEGPAIPAGSTDPGIPAPGALPPGGFGRSSPGYGTSAEQPVTASAAPGWYTMPDGQVAWWDGTQWLQSAPEVPVGPYQPLTTLSGFVLAMLALCGGLAALTAVLEGWRYTMAQEFQTSRSFSTLERMDDVGAVVAVVSLAYFLCNLVCIVVFLVWLNRVFTNLNGPLRAGPTFHSSGWAVGWWFVPFANLVKPKQVMNEAWCASEPAGPAGSMHWTRLRAPVVLSWWWATFLSGGFMSRFFISDGGRSIGVLKTQLLISTIGSALLAVAAVLAIQIVHQITARNTLRAANLGLPVR